MPRVRLGYRPKVASEVGLVLYTPIVRVRLARMATPTPPELSSRFAMAPTRTAAETVYSILEIRREIFR